MGVNITITYIIECKQLKLYGNVTMLTQDGPKSVEMNTIYKEEKRKATGVLKNRYT